MDELIERLQLKRDVWRGTEFGDDICELLEEAADTLEALRAEVERVTCELMDATTRADKLAEALRGWIWARENGASEELAVQYAVSALEQESNDA